jgi:Zn-dependent protease
VKWSWRIATVAGIDIRIHATFFLIVAWFFFHHVRAERSVAAGVEGVGFILALFACVLLHELGHALTAKRYGIRTRDITLLPIGGVARLERMPDDPRQELWVALAGPAVNVVIAGLLLAFLAVTGSLVPLGRLEPGAGPFLERLMIVNVSLVLFNLLPAFPMDGGRVLRALLATRMEYARATQVAAQIGQGMAFLFGLAGLLWNPMLLFIALFVWIGAAQEASMAMMRHSLGGIPVSRAMMVEYRTLRPDETLSQAVEAILSGSQHDFPVMEGGRLLGILPRSDLMAALARRAEGTRVGDVMRTDFPSVDPGEMLETVFLRLQSREIPCIPVLKGDALVGLLTLENLGEFLMIQAALEGRRRT